LTTNTPTLASFHSKSREEPIFFSFQPFSLWLGPVSAFGSDSVVQLSAFSFQHFSPFAAPPYFGGIVRNFGRIVRALYAGWCNVLVT